MKVFIVNGQGGVGKTTFEDLIILNNPAKMDRISMIDYPKLIAKVCGWNGQKTNKDRKFLCNLKNILTNWADLPYQYVFNYIKDEKYTGTEIVFVDAREKDDIERLKNDFNAKTILIKRGNQQNYGNPADDNVFDINYDIIIENNETLDELKEKANKFYNDYILH